MTTTTTEKISRPARIWALEEHKLHRISCSTIDHSNSDDGAVEYVRGDIVSDLLEALAAARQSIVNGCDTVSAVAAIDAALAKEARS